MNRTSKPKPRHLVTQPDDPTIRIIALTRGQETVVDAEDYDRFGVTPWLASWCRNTQSFYAKRTVSRENQTPTTVALHRVVLGLEPGDKRQVDHINGDTLDNRKVNLRICTAAENSRNRKIRADSTNGLKGIKRDSSWRARIKVDGNQIWLGCFPTAEEAHAAYVEASLKYHRDFGNDGTKSLYPEVR